MTAETDAPRLVPVSVAQHAANNMRIAYHKTRVTREVMVSPDDLSVVLDFVSQAAAPAVQPAAGREEIARIIDPSSFSTQYFAHKGRVADALAKADAILAAISTPAQASGEPVAWRYRTAAHRAWHFTSKAVEADAEREDGSEVQPLYAHPPAQASETGRVVSADDVARMTCFANNHGDLDDWAAWCRIRSALSAPQAAPGEGEGES